MSRSGVDPGDRLSRLNRTVLAILGLVLLTAGGWALAARFGGVAHDGLVPAGEPPAWLPWALLAPALILGAGCVRWAVAQVIRPSRPARWSAAVSESADTVTVDSAVVAGPVAAEIAQFPGVCEAHARLSGPGHLPTLHLMVTVDPAADVPALRERIRRRVLPRLCQALEVDEIPAQLAVQVLEVPVAQ